MVERRHAERFLLVDPGVGTLRMVQDVEVTELSARHAEVIAPAPLRVGERLLLEVPGERHARPSTVLVRVVDNRVVADDDSLRRRVRLEMSASAPCDLEFPKEQLARGTSVTGALIRRAPVRVIEASTRGCVFDSPSIVVEGAVGFVQMRTATREHSEAVRVRRTARTSDRVWQYRMAAEFLTSGLTSPLSFRGLAAVMSAGSPASTEF